MNSLKRIGAVLAVGGAAFLGWWLALPLGATPAPAEAQENGVTFPPLEQFVHYTTVERGDVMEQMMTSKEAIAAIRAQQPLPVGTQVVLVDHRGGTLLRYLVAQKMGDGRDDWQYQSFMPDRTSIQADENPARCFSCHQSRQDRQYMYTYTDALRYE